MFPEVIPVLPRILIEKAARRLTLFREGFPPLSFPIALGSSPQGTKKAEGDGRTPEGCYYVCTRNEKSKFHLALGISYPSHGDARLAISEGRIDRAALAAIDKAWGEGRRPPWDTPLGGFIMIHGGGTSTDWTAGCVALEDGDMDVLFPLCPMGTAVEIVP